MSMSVIIVEDDPIIAIDLAEIVKDAGFPVAGIACDMDAALDLADTHDVGVAVVDLALARGSSGLETAARLREVFAVPSLFVSGSLTAQVEASALAFAPIGFVSKPYRPEQIVKPLCAAEEISRHIGL